MRRPPPKEKGLASVNMIIESLPDRGRSSWHLGAVWALSQYQENEVLTVPTFTAKTIRSLLQIIYIYLISREASFGFTMYFCPCSLPPGWMTCLLFLHVALPGHVSWWALHREASKGGHGEVQEAVSRDNPLHQDEERGEEAAVL